MKKFIEVMKALSDPNRVRIVKMLQHRSMCVCELQAGLGISQPTVSSILRYWKDPGWLGLKKMACGWIIFSLMEAKVHMPGSFWGT